MRIFAPLYERALAWSRHRLAWWYLGGLSFIEAFIFPVPPEVMLAPMTLVQPKRWWKLASFSLGFSLLGSLVGYALGHFAWESLRPLLSDHMREVIDTWTTTLRNDMNAHWLTMLGALTLAALQPVIPMKFVTWAAGIVGVPIVPFLACMTVGRGKRVYLLCGAVRLGGERAEALLRRYIEWIGWVVLLLAGLALAWWWLR